MNYNFGCMIASDTQFDFRGWVFGVKLSDEDIAEMSVKGSNWLCLDDSD